MYLVELTQKAKQQNKSPIYDSMVNFRNRMELLKGEGAPLPYISLCANAADVHKACTEYLDLTLRPKDCPTKH